MKIITEKELLEAMESFTGFEWSMEEDLITQCHDSLDAINLIHQIEVEFDANIRLAEKMFLSDILKTINSGRR
jgi:acyl carrier protein